jgi:DNA-binding CsgD family transcriptional regulator
LATETFFAEAPEILSYLKEHGLSDAWLVNGRVAPVEGCLLIAYLAKSRRPSIRALRRAARIARALSNAIRLRRQLAIAGAVEQTDSAVVRAARADLALRMNADSESPPQLNDSSLEQARNCGRAALRPVDRFSFEGVSYIILRSTESSSNVEQLSPREREVLDHAAAGSSNKAIGYELGVAASTVGVLLGRGARKLGAGSRREAIARYREGGGGAPGAKSSPRGRRSGRPP